MRLRENRDFFKLILSNWQLACLFIDKSIHGDPARRAEVLATRLGTIYQLNNLRRELIPDDLRRRMPIRDQQLLVLSARDANRSRPQQRVNVPVIEQGAITLKIEAAQEAGQINIPNELICPVSMSLFKDPVVVHENGKDYYFERTFIEEALKVKQQNPLTRQPLQLADLKPSPDKAAAVAAFKKEFADQLPKTSTSPASSKK